MSTYPADVLDANGQVRTGNSIIFTDAVNQPGSALPAVVDASALPTVDPAVAGQLWVNSGVVTRSAG